MPSPFLLINEVFYSLQGESTWSGLPCVFVRLRGCHLRCHYCDTQYAFHEGARRTIDDLISQVKFFGCNLVEVTGGEPLLQKAVHPFMTALCDNGFTVLLETSGACDISPCDKRVMRIMDIKTPGSGQSAHNLWSNINNLSVKDEVKFVLCDRNDYEWAREKINQYDLSSKVNAVLMSAVAAMPASREVQGVKGLPLDDLAKWILEDHLHVRMQTQLHKIIWDPMTRGV